MSGGAHNYNMSTATNTKYIPKDAQVIMAILKELGINDFDPRVINQLLEFIYWHTTIILDDARVFANHAKKKNIDVDDVKLAIQMHAEQMSSAGPPRDILLELARNKNSTSLSPVKPQSGIRLPPDRYCLTQPNYKLKSNLPNANKKQVTSSVNAMNVSMTSPVQLTTTPVLKQMPMIPPRTVSTSSSSSNFPIKSIQSETSSTTSVSVNESNISRSEIKAESEVDLMEIDPLSSHI